MIVYSAKIAIPGLKGHVRDIRPVWLLEELKVPYETRFVDFNSGENKQPDYLRVHPLGKVPALRDGDLVLFESAAICGYIADRHPQAGLIPAAGTRERALYDQWMYFAMSSLEPRSVQVFGARIFGDGPEDLAQALAEHGPALAPMLKLLDDRLAKQDYILGARFSVADIFISAAAAFLEATDAVKDYPSLAAYQKRVRGRPSFQTAYAASTGGL